MNSIACFVYSVERPHASAPRLSTGYADIASAVLPLGRLMRAASHTNARQAPNATSREFFIWKCHVRVGEPLGRLDGLVTSSGVRIRTVLSLWRAWARRACSAGLSTSVGFTSSPEPTTIMFDGTVTR